MKIPYYLLLLPILGALVVPVRVDARQTSRSELPSEIREADRLEIHAIAAASAPTLDGKLDDAVWQLGRPITGFVQAEPDEGRPATQRTEVWVAIDADNVYVAAYLHDDHPDQIVINDIRRDFRTDAQDTFEVIFDTFGDRRNGYMFATNAAGARSDEQVTNEGRETNASWDAPWSVRTAAQSDGWSLEMLIPLRALRSATGSHPTWGINFSRRIRRNNEVVFWAPIPRAFTLTRLSLAGNLVGLNNVVGGRDLRITPYILARTVRETGGPEFDEQADVGGDLKYGLTNGLTVDLTVNPDFAQAEADVQQVNLTQFSQFFPEKRDFFLENSGLFYIGDTPRNTRLATAPRGDEDLLVFFSRRMGLSADGNVIPIDAGIRLTGQEGSTQIGALALRTRDRPGYPSSDWGVLRLRQNVFANSDIGGLFMARSEVDDRGDYNYIYGGDANIRLPAHVDWSSFLINSETPGVSGSRYAVQSSLNREANFVHMKLSLLAIGENFNDDLGFVRRTGIRKWHADLGIRPRVAALRRHGVREMHPHIVWSYITDPSGHMLAKRFHSGYTLFFSNGAFAELSVNPASETVDTDFVIHPDADPIPAGRHDWNEWTLRGTTDPSRTLSFEFTGTVGGLWTGTQKTLQLSGTMKPSYHFTGALGVSRTDADLGGTNGKFVREIWTATANYSFTPNMFVDALAQYDVDGDLVNINVRFNFIHSPLSDLFVVYNEQRFTTDGAPVPGRSVIVKFTKMLSL